MGQRPSRRHSFILSLWSEGSPLPNAPTVWRYSLEDPHSAQRRGFKDLAELMQFLEARLAFPEMMIEIEATAVA